MSRLTAGAGALVAAALTLLVSGCGIRTTSVPVDAGAAPTRVPCSLTGESSSAAAQGVPLRVHLVCGAQLEVVERGAPLPEERAGRSPLRTAAELLELLVAGPSEEERAAGFTTAVRGPMTVKGARAGDPAGTLRLNRQPEDLAPTALSQIVCTFAESAAGAGEHTVLLGGPGAYAPKRYRCTPELRERPESAPPLGTVPTATVPGPSDSAAPASEAPPAQ
ncbi:hypothetical protein [Streptomyces sp.]|uniref:hypothetical protein n=1 Tax=Streptomyces sp. TaxID=1931 RepID=UPI002811628E|nr:hypothetical protein [Streptomyces sp.]